MNTMKIIALTFVLLFHLVPEVHAQDEDKGSKIADLIKKGNSKELAQHLNTTVQLVLPDDEGRFSRTQGEFILKNFFTKYPPKSFIINHQGSSSDGSRYFIGSYVSEAISFRTYYLIKQVDGKMLIHQLRFENEN